MNQDLTVGKPGTVLWKFCLPLFGSIVFQQLYNIADSLVAGKFIGEGALAAVGNGYEVTLMFIAVAFGCNIGCSVITAQKFGARQYGEARTTVYTTLIASGVICLVLMAGGFLGLEGLLHLIHTPEDVFADSMCYLQIYILSLPFVFYYNVATGIFSAFGDSKTPFYLLVASSLSNIGADILFVTAFHMGVDGVAWATLICQGVSCIAAMALVHKRVKSIPAKGKVPLFSWKLLGSVAVVAVPSMLQQSFISVGNMMIQSIINTFGSAVMAGYSGAIKLNNLVVTAFTTLGNGVSNYTAQNLGADKPARIRQGYKSGILMVGALCLPLSLLYFFCGGTLMRLDRKSRPGLLLVCPVIQLRNFFLDLIQQIYGGFLNGLNVLLGKVVREQHIVNRELLITGKAFPDIALLLFIHTLCQIHQVHKCLFNCGSVLLIIIGFYDLLVTLHVIDSLGIVQQHFFQALLNQFVQILDHQILTLIFCKLPGQQVKINLTNVKSL